MAKSFTPSNKLAMREISTCIRLLSNALSFFDYDLSCKGNSKLIVDSTLPFYVLDTIRKLKSTRGWSWNGEYEYHSKENGVLDIYMYSYDGTSRIIHINETGGSTYIYKMGTTRFWVH
jgi:hypothetical protein